MRARQFTPLALFVAAAMQFGIVPLQAQDEPVYTLSRCWKANPGRAADLQAFFDNDGRVLAQEAIKQGRIVGYSASQAVIPQGENARCDFLTSHRYVGYPSQLGIVTDEGMAKLKLKDGQLGQRVRPLGRIVDSGLFRMEAFAGMGEEGSYVMIDLMKTTNNADWVKAESEIFQPMQAARIKAGDLQAWSAHTMVMPRGADLEYNAATVNVQPDLKSFGKPARYRQVFESVHSGKSFNDASAQTQKSRTIVESNLYRAIVVIAPE